jgi:dTDP-4-amino-4,6-dideoxygalactose transaminase
VPVHLQQAYADLKIAAGTYPNAEKASLECLSLPLFPELTDEQVQTVAAAIQRWKP